MAKLLLLLTFCVFTTVGWVPSGEAQFRQLPQNGKRGMTGENLQYPMVRIGRESLRLAPGGIIFNTENRTILHQSLPPNADVWYQINRDGEVQRIYILTPTERATLDKAGK
ncbi:MAG: hypothetical protein FJY56_07010 [Betaproteobacteria bacterium]|nr:hypothetical protein [Betaproteobacteria bacterium]